MLFQSDYWLASNINEQAETLHSFLTTDAGITSLVIILKTGNNDVGCVLNGITDDTEFDCNINLITKSGTETYGSDPAKHTKSIYVFSNLDAEAITLMQTTQPIFAIFV